MRLPAFERVGLISTLTMLTLSVALVVMIGRVVQLQVSPSPELRPFIQERLSTRSEIAPRGDVLDRRGRLLAATRSGERVFVDPARFAQPWDESMIRLARAIGADPSVVGARLFPRLAEHARRVEEGASPIRYVRVSDILRDEQAEAVRALKIPGVHLELTTVREGAHAHIASSILGRVDVDHDGQFGAERVFDAQLQGRDGRLRYVRDARGGPLWIEHGGYAPPVSGRPVYLSIDLRLQSIAEEELERAVLEQDAAGGRVVVIDPNTGELLAMVDMVRDLGGAVAPWGERPKPGGPQRRTIIPPDPNRLIHPAAGRNRNATDLYEPGSTFKSFTWSVLTDAGVVKLDEVFKTGGKQWRTPYGRLIRDVFGYAQQTWREVLINSSNIGMSMAAERVSHKQMRDGIVKFGFGQRTGLGFVGEREGRVPPALGWSKYTQTSVSFGQEVAVTPLQMARAFCVFARTGEMAGTIPELRLSAADPSSSESRVVRRVLPPHVALAARDAMAVVGEKADERMRFRKLDTTYRYSMFGKSGTAQVALPGERGYVPNQYVSSFVAGAPVESPRVVVLVVIDDPGPETIARVMHRGSTSAAPVVRRIVERSLSYLGATPCKSEELASAR